MPAPRRAAFAACEPLLRRAAFLGGAAAVTAIAVDAFAALLALNGTTAFETAMLVAFVPLTAWIALSSWSAILGWIALLLRFRPDGLSRLPDDVVLSARTAVLVPVYNEEPRGVFANLSAMREALARCGAGAAFDLFVLSDSTDPAVWLAEESAWQALAGRPPAAPRVYYRRRAENSGRKAGNIAEFCRRFGAGYDFLVVLDADSLMAGETLVALARLMQANPRVGLIQVPPRLINRMSLFGRLQQFASALTLPVLARGIGFWQLGQGNYWGHNAILRTAAFTASCGLPTLPGKPPLGGHILSHDFVEAALLVRAGWQVWMAPALAGSWEESPPSLLDHLLRDRRWCQGNLQHARLLAAEGLHPISRLHLAMGVMSYLASPLWALFLLAGLAEAVSAAQREHAYFAPDSPFPQWLLADPEHALLLLGLAFGLLLLPKLLGALACLADGERRRAMGGGAAILAGLLLESLVSTLSAPMVMVYHSLFVAEVLLGLDSGWQRQSRAEGRLGWGVALRAAAAPLLVGLGLAALMPLLPVALLWWLAPLVLGLLLAPAILRLGASTALGRGAARAGLLLTPEERAPPTVVARARALAAEGEVLRFDDPLAALRADPARLALHAVLVADDPEMRADPQTLAVAREKQAHGLPLLPAEQAALLADLATLDAWLDTADDGAALPR